MRFILIVAGLIFFLDLVWWFAWARFTPASNWHVLIPLFMSAQILGFVWLFAGRLAPGNFDRWLPKFVLADVFIWHMILLPVLLAFAILAVPILTIKAAVHFFREPQPAKIESSAGQWNRRQFLGFAAAAVPPLLTFGLTTVALTQLNRFRVRRMVLSWPDLPPDLDGLTIAHVSDMHVGRFTSGRVLRDMVNTVNGLRADLVLSTGDLINDALADLDQGIELIRAMEGGFGTYLIEGNHDLIEDPAQFESRVRASGIQFLLDQTAVLTIRGAPLQLLGLSWTRAHQDRDTAIANAVRQLLQQRQPNAFPILLAHHPHAFDAAAEASIPLTLSGHTHGGQLMLNEQLGFGPAMFKYWSGLYTRGDSKLIVSNGVGNWFPLRTRAPAELVHLTLRRA